MIIFLFQSSINFQIQIISMKKTSHHRSKLLLQTRKTPLEIKSSLQQTLTYNIIRPMTKTINQKVNEVDQKNQRIKQKQKKMKDLFYQIVKQNDFSDSEDHIIKQINHESEPFRKVVKQYKNISQLKLHSNKIYRTISTANNMLNHCQDHKLQSSILSRPKSCSNNIIQKQNSFEPIYCFNGKIPKQLRAISMEIAKSKNVLMSNYGLTATMLGQIRLYLLNNENLKALDLSYNQLSNKAISIIVQVVEKRGVQNLSLKWNQLTSVGVEEFVNKMSCNSSLKDLNLSYNCLHSSTSSFPNSMSKFIANNRTLFHLNLEQCKITSEHCEIIAKALNYKNNTIIGLHFKGNSNYKVNENGFIVEDKNSSVKIFDNTIFSKSILQNRLRSNSAPLFKQKQIVDANNDCCWICDKWKNHCFTKTCYLSTQLKDESSVLFIHLSCYNYQPIQMNSHPPEISFPRYSYLLKKSQWQTQIYFLNIPIPQNQKILYFFTSSNMVYLDHSKQSQVVKYGKQITFDLNCQLLQIDELQQGANKQGSIDKEYKLMLDHINIIDHYPTKAEINDQISCRNKEISKYNSTKYINRDEEKYAPKQSLMKIKSISKICLKPEYRQEGKQYQQFKYIPRNKGNFFPLDISSKIDIFCSKKKKDKTELKQLFQDIRSFVFGNFGSFCSTKMSIQVPHCQLFQLSNTYKISNITTILMLKTKKQRSTSALKNQKKSPKNSNGILSSKQSKNQEQRMKKTVQFVDPLESSFSLNDEVMSLSSSEDLSQDSPEKSPINKNEKYMRVNRRQGKRINQSTQKFISIEKKNQMKWYGKGKDSNNDVNNSTIKSILPETPLCPFDQLPLLVHSPPQNNGELPPFLEELKSLTKIFVCNPRVMLSNLKQHRDIHKIAHLNDIITTYNHHYWLMRYQEVLENLVNKQLFQFENFDAIVKREGILIKNSWQALTQHYLSPPPSSLSSENQQTDCQIRKKVKKKAARRHGNEMHDLKKTEIFNFKQKIVQTEQKLNQSSNNWEQMMFVQQQEKNNIYLYLIKKVDQMCELCKKVVEKVVREERKDGCEVDRIIANNIMSKISKFLCDKFQMFHLPQDLSKINFIEKELTQNLLILVLKELIKLQLILNLKQKTENSISLQTRSDIGTSYQEWLENQIKIIQKSIQILNMNQGNNFGSKKQLSLGNIKMGRTFSILSGKGSEKRLKVRSKTRQNGLIKGKESRFKIKTSEMKLKINKKKAVIVTPNKSIEEKNQDLDKNIPQILQLSVKKILHHLTQTFDPELQSLTPRTKGKISEEKSKKTQI